MPAPRRSAAPELPPSLADIERLVDAAFAALPPEVRAVCADLVLRVEDFADDTTLADLGLEDPFELTGLYEGVALHLKSSFDQPVTPDVVWLFRRPILEEWIERGDIALDALVTHVLVHEVAHHLGWSDDDIRRIDDWTQ